MALKSILIKNKQNVPPGDHLECSDCNELFGMTSKYLSHMATHKHFILSCNICNKGFYDQKLLDEHYLTHTEVINTYDCTECPRKFLQKYQLEQHMQFHSITSSEPVVKKKKSVHFNNILESRNVDDFEDSNEGQYSSDDDFEDYNPVNKITKTRSGRLVKQKMLFNDEPEMKRKCRRSAESFTNFSVTSEENSHPVETAVTQNTTVQPIKIFNKELSVVVERIPDHIFAKYVEKGNVCTFKFPSSPKSDFEPIEENFSKLSSNTKVCDNKVSKSSVIGNRAKYSDNSKLRKKSKAENMFNAVKLNFNSNSLEISIQEVKSDAVKMNVDSANNSLISLNSDIFNTATSSKVNITDYPINSKFSPKSKKSSCKTAGFVKKPSVKLSHATSKVIPNFSAPKLSQSGKEFLYVGTKPDMDKLKQVIAEVKAMSKEKSSFKTNNFSPAQCNESLKSANVSNLKNSEQSCLSSINKVSSVSISSSCQTINVNQSDSLINGKSILNKDKLNHKVFNSEEGILDKKMVQNFVVIKVTPEYMQKIQRKSFEMTSPVTSAGKTPNALLSVCDRNSKLDFIVKRESLSVVNDIPLASDSRASCETVITNDSKMLKSTCSKATSKKIMTIERNKDNKIAPSSNLELPKTLVKEEKLLQRCLAKLKEKERKKKEKYEFKKKMRYMEKLCKPRHSSDDVKKTYSKEKCLSPNNIKKSDSDGKCSFPEKISKDVTINGKTDKILNNKNLKLGKINNNTKFSRMKSKLLAQANKDPFSDVSVASKDTFAIARPCNSKECRDSLQMDSAISPSNIVFKSSKDCEIFQTEKAIQKADKIVNNKNSKLEKMTNNTKFSRMKSKLLAQANKDPFSAVSVTSKDTFTIACPCNSKECTDSLHMNSVIPSSNNVSKNSKDCKMAQTEEEAIQKAHDISLKFNKNLSEAEHLKLLNELDYLITHFEISGKCLFLSPIIRFCRLYVNSNKVKEQAVSLSTKFTKALSR